MESDTAVRRIKPSGTQNYVAQDNSDGHRDRDRCGDNGYSGDPKRKPEVKLYLLREGLAASLLSVFILVLWGLVHLSLQQLVIGKPCGDFNAVRASLTTDPPRNHYRVSPPPPRKPCGDCQVFKPGREEAQQPPAAGDS